VIEFIENKFGKIAVMHGKEHIFLGMDAVFNGDCTVDISMRTYLEEALVEFGKGNCKPPPQQERIYLRWMTHHLH